MKIYLVRHGEKEDETKDPPLTEKGERQINLLARRLKQEKVKVSKIYTTNYLRTIKTADIISKKLCLPVVRDDRLNELYSEFFYLPDVSVEHEMIFAVKTFVDELVSKKQDVILAMHGGINRAIISHLTGISLKEMRFFGMDFGSISLIEYTELMGKNIWRVKFLNDATHLKVP